MVIPPAYPHELGRTALWFSADNETEGVGSGGWDTKELPELGEMRGVERANLVSGQASGEGLRRRCPER